MERNKRSVAFIIAGALVFMMLFSVYFISAESVHECSGEDCPICYQISVCENAVKSVGTCVTVLTAIGVLFGYFAEISDFSDQKRGAISLVSLKVKLSN